MPEIKQKSDDSQLHWFWRVTTKLYFFPLFYITLALLLSILDGLMRKEVSLGTFFYALAMMPQGLLLLVGILHFVQDSPLPIYLVFHPLLLASIIVINYYKTRKKVVLKWLIITWLLLIILSFAGCLTIAGFYS